MDSPKSELDALLINSHYISRSKYPPLSLINLAAFAEQNKFNVEICDAAVLKLTEKEILAVIKEKKPKCIGLTFVSCQYTNTLVLGFLIKKYFPEILLIAGGIHPNTLPESTLREMSFIDFIILGEGENTFIEILQCLRNQDRSKIENILGICFLKSGNFIKNQPRPLIPDLNILPMPAWHKIPISNYDVSQPSLRYKRQQGKALTISSSRGCPYQCIFCASHGVLGNSYRYRSFYKVVDELEFLVNKFNVRYFFFVDEVLFQNREHVLGLANEIIKRGLDIQWAGSSRVNAPGIDEAVLKTVLKAGCVRIDFGVESGSSKILKEIRKNISIDEIKNAHKKTHECGLATTTLMMVGHPSESLDDVRDSIRLIAFIDSEYPEFGPATPFPGTALHDIAKKNGWIRSYYWSDYIIGYWYQVMRNQHFDYDEIQDLSFFCNSFFQVLFNIKKMLRSLLSHSSQK
jgi:radical SAM superfamily enzyme YgiQ (UPF0313 family)